MLNILSFLVGKIANQQFPKSFQTYLNIIFVWYTKINLSEFSPVESYPSLQKLFTRSLLRSRKISKNINDVIVPTDSKIMQFGEIKNGEILQVKGLSYSVKNFLQIENVEKLNGGAFINFYLSPEDYHHFHAPCDFSISKITHISGNLFPVKQSYLENKKNLFIENTRVVIEAEINNKKMYFIAIGALNVGSINVFCEPRIQTNLNKKNNTFSYETPIKICKGDDIGVFEMGSSVVLIFEKDVIQFFNNLKIGQKIKFGEIFAIKNHENFYSFK